MLLPESEQEVRIRFTEEESGSSSEVLAVPGTLEAAGLGEVASHLGLSGSFFLVGGHVLQTSLAMHASVFGLSTEDVIPVSLLTFPALREEQDTCQDWIGALAGQSVGLYDGTVDGVPTHEGPVKAMALSSREGLRASGGQDALVKVQGKTLKGHGTSIDSLTFSGEDRLFSGDFNGMLFAWRRLQEDFELATTHSAHAGCVSGLAALNEETLVSSSWDHTVKLWDPSRLDLRRGSPKLGTVQLDVCAVLDRLVAAAGHDGLVRLLDSRGKLVPVSFAKTHSDSVSAVDFDFKTSLLYSASHDGTVNAWDLRAVKPLHTYRFSDDSLLALTCDSEDGTVYAGGKAGKLRKLSLSSSS
mmetsp:Transcript_34539/g.110917  ORF Transcript_34539/g.110917 Transcript_34539/m.110917 type:complete len:357 (-) Transcript_34539:11-1081(-)